MGLGSANEKSAEPKPLLRRSPERRQNSTWPALPFGSAAASTASVFGLFSPETGDFLESNDLTLTRLSNCQRGSVGPRVVRLISAVNCLAACRSAPGKMADLCHLGGGTASWMVTVPQIGTEATPPAAQTADEMNHRECCNKMLRRELLLLLSSIDSPAAQLGYSSKTHFGDHA